MIGQHFCVMEEMIEMMKETAQELALDIAELIEALNFEDENFGEVLFQKS